MFPLKVLCVDGSDRGFPDPKAVLPVEGKIYTAISQGEGWNEGGQVIPCYEIEELENIQIIEGHEAKQVYECDRFVPLSDKDETEYADSVLNSLFQTVENVG